MPEHRIRLRGAWDLLPPDGDPTPPRRVALPVDWPGGMDGPFRLRRRFGGPPLGPAGESIRLEFESVPGLLGCRLDGVAIGGPPAGAADWSVDLVDPLPPRNELILDVDPGRWRGSPSGWGSIALVIATRAVDGR